MPASKADDPEQADKDTLSSLLRERVFAAPFGSVAKVTKKAKELGLASLKSDGNITAYMSGERGVKPKIIKKFEKLFGEEEDSWLPLFSFGKGSSHAPMREKGAILNGQSTLEPGDVVTLISSRAFLEATNKEVADVAKEQLGRGVVFTYYFPNGGSHPYGTDAADSFHKFYHELSRSTDLKAPPLFIGFAVNPVLFKFFSSLHTIVHFKSETSPLRGAHCYIERAGARRGETVQSWYPLPDSVWKEIVSNLAVARNPVGDSTIPVVGLNPCVRGIGLQYVRWFQTNESVSEYIALRSALGHSGEECLLALKRELGSRRHEGSTLRYLDIGCGDGSLTCEIAKYLAAGVETITVTGLDVSGAQLRTACAAFNRANMLSFNPEERKFEDYDPRNVDYDVITAIHSLYVVDAAYVRRIFSLLAPGGTAYIWMASGDDNVITSLCNAIDDVLRPSQRRNTAEDVARHVELAGIRCRLTYPDKDRKIENLIDQNNEPTEDGQRLINFCALEPANKTSKAWKPAVKVLVDGIVDGRKHRLKDALIVIRRDV